LTKFKTLTILIFRRNNVITNFVSIKDLNRDFENLDWDKARDIIDGNVDSYKDVENASDKDKRLLKFMEDVGFSWGDANEYDKNPEKYRDNAERKHIAWFHVNGGSETCIIEAPMKKVNAVLDKIVRGEWTY